MLHEKLCLYYLLLFLGAKQWGEVSTKKLRKWKKEVFKVSNAIALLCIQNVAVFFLTYV